MKKAVIFPGQGAQFAGMGKDLFDDYPLAQQMFSKADDILGFKISQMCFSPEEGKLVNTLYQQVGIFLVSAVCWEILKAEKNIDFDYAAGLSLGEYTAVYAAGALSFEEALKLVQKRAEAMEEAAGSNPSFMLALIGIDKEELEKKGPLPFSIANLNCPQQVVVSADKKKRAEVEDFLAKLSLKRVVELKVSGGFHAPFMEPAKAKLAAALDEASFSSLRFPVVSNVDAQAHEEIEKIKDNLLQQLTSPVLWQKSVEFMKEKGVGEFYEVGPSKVLKGLLRRIDKSLSVFNFGQSSDFKKEAV